MMATNARILARPLLQGSLRRSLSSMKGGWGTTASTVPRRVTSPQYSGKSVAFHVRDLKPPPPEPLFMPSSYSHSERTIAEEAPSSDRLRVVLDLDECLVHCRVFGSHLDAAIYSHQRRNVNHPSSDSFRTYMPSGAHIHVWMRPGLLDFLRQCTAQYETYIFTASLPGYANPILDHLCASVRQVTSSPTGIFRGRFYRHHCTYDPLQNEYVKDLTTLPKQLSNHLHRTVLVDNNPFSFLKQPENGILVRPFYNEANNDVHAPLFSELLLQLQELSQVPDVRSILNAAAQNVPPPVDLTEPPCQMAAAV